MEQPNFSYINKLSGGDKTFNQKLITIIKAEFPEEKATYKKNINTKNFKAAAESVHKLKHKISILGLERSYKIASDYENDLKEHHDDSAKQAFEAILKTITDFLETI